MRIVTDTNNPAEVAGAELSVHLEIHRGTPVLLLLSGGSALSLLAYVPSSLLGSHCTIAMLDERYSADPAVNNFALLTTTEFYNRAVACGVSFFDSRPRAGETAAELATRFETFLRQWHQDNPAGSTLATLGMGEDGHTAGIFPGFVEVLDSDGRLVAAYTLPPSANPYPERVTVTPHFLTTVVDVGIAYVVGESKRAPLTAVYQCAVLPATHPATLWHRMNKVTVVTDQLL